MALKCKSLCITFLLIPWLIFLLFSLSVPASSIIVNTVTLNMMYQATDLSYSGRGPGIAITRTHNADDSRDGPFGPSWTFNYNATLTENSDGSIDVREGSGTIHRFNSAGNGKYTPPAGKYDTLTKNGDGTYSLKLKGSKLTQKFHSSRETYKHNRSKWERHNLSV